MKNYHYSLKNLKERGGGVLIAMVTAHGHFGQMTKSLKKTFWVDWLFIVTSRCVEWYRAVVSEKFYEYMSTVWGLRSGIVIRASLLFDFVLTPCFGWSLKCSCFRLSLPGIVILVFFVITIMVCVN